MRNNMTNSPTLATPHPALLTHSLACTQLIRDEIHRRGKIDFATFMQLALYAPRYGYYTGGLQKLGQRGDFITAPDISSLFAKTIACHIANTLKNCTSPNILEFGPGRGTMAAELLLQLERLEQLPETYFCLELSPDLAARQQDKINEVCPHLAARVSWLTALPEKPFEGVILANEVLDAMPVHLFSLSSAGIEERFVTWSHDQFEWVLDAPSPIVAKHAQMLIEKYRLSAPYQSEINTFIHPWLQSASDCLTKGTITLVDYGFLGAGYYHPQRNNGTLMCHYQHHNHPDPFFLPGAQDITAHVDFSCVMDAAKQANLTIDSFDTQANFLLEAGITKIFEEMSSAEPKAQMLLSRELQTLIFPHEMGELFKVINLSKR